MIKDHIIQVLEMPHQAASPVSKCNTRGSVSYAAIEHSKAGAAPPAASATGNTHVEAKAPDDSASEVVAKAAVVQYTQPGGESVGTSMPLAGRLVAASRVPASKLPLILSKSASSQSKPILLLQAEKHDDALDFSGDVGAVGRLTASSSGIILDLQGHRYAGSLVPSNSSLVVSLSKLAICIAARPGTVLFAGASEAKVEHVCNEFVQLEHLENVIARMGGERFKIQHIMINIQIFLATGAQLADTNDGGRISQLLAFNDVDDDADADQSHASTKQMLGTSRKIMSKRKKARRV